MDNGDLDFYLEPDTHEYTSNGMAVPAATRILELARPSLAYVPREVLQKATDRGRKTHKAIELLMKDDLDNRDKLGREINPRLEQWEWFMKTYEVQPLYVARDQLASPLLQLVVGRNGELVEVPLVHPAYCFGVTPDVPCIVRGEPAVVEIKCTSSHNKATALQTAAQAETLNRVFQGVLPRIERRYSVRLVGGKGSKPDVRMYDEPSDWATFLTFMNVYNWRERNLR